jgi:hypothetical protein
MSGIHQALRHRHFDRASAILQDDPSAAEEADGQGLLPVDILAADVDTDALAALKEALKAAPDTACRTIPCATGMHQSPATIAIGASNPRALKLMVDLAGPDALHVDEGCIALQHAHHAFFSRLNSTAERRSRDCLVIVLDTYVRQRMPANPLTMEELEHSTPYRGTTLAIACERQHLDLARLLLQFDPSEAARPQACIRCAMTGDLSVMEAYLHADGGLLDVDVWSNTVLHELARARSANHADIAELVLDREPMLASMEWAVNTSGSTPLHIAATCESTHMVDILLRRAPHLTLCTDDQRRTALHRALRAGSDRCVPALMHASRAILAEPDVHGATPLVLLADWLERGDDEDAIEDLEFATLFSRSKGDIPPSSEGVWAADSQLQAYYKTGCMSIKHIARALLALHDRDVALGILRTWHERAPYIVRDLFAPTLLAHMPLGIQGWACVPCDLPGLLQALPMAIQHSAEEVRHLVRRMARPDLLSLTHVLKCLNKVGLPVGPVQTILAKCF